MLVAPTLCSRVAPPGHVVGARRALRPSRGWRKASALGVSCLWTCRRLRSGRKAEEQVVTPWEVEAGEDGVDYAPQP